MKVISDATMSVSKRKEASKHRQWIRLQTQKCQNVKVSNIKSVGCPSFALRLYELFRLGSNNMAEIEGLKTED